MVQRNSALCAKPCYILETIVFLLLLFPGKLYNDRGTTQITSTQVTLFQWPWPRASGTEKHRKVHK